MGETIQSKKMRDATKTIRRKEDFDNETTALKRIFGIGDMFSEGWKYSYNWKSNPRHWFTYSLVAFLWTQCIYSQIKCFVDGEYGRIFELFALYGICSSFAQKPWIFLKYYKALTALRTFNLKINQKAGRHMAEKLNNQQMKNLKLCNLVVLSVFLVDVVFAYCPLTQLVFSRKLVPLLPIEMIFLDQTKLFDFLIANSLTPISSV